MGVWGFLNNSTYAFSLTLSFLLPDIMYRKSIPLARRALLIFICCDQLDLVGGGHTKVDLRRLGSEIQRLKS